MTATTGALRARRQFPPAMKGVVAGLAAVGMWASYLAYARAGVNGGLLPQDFLLLRYGTAGLIMLPWLLGHNPQTLAGVGWGNGTVLTLLAGPLFILLGVGGYVFAPLSHGAVIQPATIALGGMVAAAVFLRERLIANKLAGGALMVIGLSMTAGGGGTGAAPQAFIGDLLFVGAGLLWVSFTLLLRRWRIGALQATASVSVLSAAAVVPGFLLFADLSRIAALDPEVLITQIVVQGFFSGVLAVVAYGMSIQTLGASKAVLFPALVPTAALVLGVPITGEIPGVLEIFGGVAATIGLLVAIGSTRPHRPAS